MRRHSFAASSRRVTRRLATASLLALPMGACGEAIAPADAVVPEGTIVLGVADRPPGETSRANGLWRVDRSGTLRSHPGFTESLYEELTPTPDHRRFSYEVGGRLVLDDARGTRDVLVPEQGGGARQSRWSPDGRHVAFVRSRAGGGTDLSIMRLADRRIVTPTATLGGGCANDPRSPAFFPIGWESPERFRFYWLICFAADRYFAASASGELQELSWPVPHRWVSPDGQRVLTVQNGRPVVSNPDGGNARIVADIEVWPTTGGWPTTGIWSPSGRHLIIAEVTSSCLRLHVVAADGSSRFRIPDDPGCRIALSWSPSGEWIATTVRDTNRPVLRLYRADGSEIRDVPLSLPTGQFLLSAAWITD